MKKWIVPLVLTVITLTSCQKEIAWDDETTSGTDSLSATDTYQPVTAGSKWTYRMHQSFKIDASMFAGIDLSALGFTQEEFLALLGLASTGYDTTYEYTLTSLGADTMINANKYAVFTTTIVGEETRAYFRKDNNSYYQLAPAVNIGGTGGAGDVQTLYLKDNQPVGTTWQEDLNAGGAGQHITYTIKNKGITKQVNGITYKDVIEVEVKASANTAGIPDLPAGFDLSTVTTGFFAKNIGLIYEEQPPAMGASMTIELLKAEIK